MGRPPEHRQVMPPWGLGVGGPWGNGLDEGPRVALGIPRGILSRETRGHLINKRPTVSGVESPPAMRVCGSKPKRRGSNLRPKTTVPGNETTPASQLLTPRILGGWSTWLPPHPGRRASSWRAPRVPLRRRHPSSRTRLLLTPRTPWLLTRGQRLQQPQLQRLSMRPPCCPRPQRR